jgi:hypothetical protein
MHLEPTFATRVPGPYLSTTAVPEAVLAIGPDRGSIERLRRTLGTLAAHLRPPVGTAPDADPTHRTVLQAAPRLAKAVADHLGERDRLALAVNELLAYLDGSDLLHEADAADLGGEG